MKFSFYTNVRRGTILTLNLEEPEKKSTYTHEKTQKKVEMREYIGCKKGMAYSPRLLACEPIQYTKLRLDYAQYPWVIQMRFSKKWEEIFSMIWNVTTISLLSAAKKPLAINFTHSLQRIGRNALFEITLFPKNCIENNTLLKITIAQEQAQMLNPLYELVSKIAQISLKGFCPFDDILFNVKSLSTLNDIQYSTSPYINMVILLFSSANLGIISASDILYLSKFLNISLWLGRMMNPSSRSRAISITMPTQFLFGTTEPRTLLFFSSWFLRDVWWNFTICGKKGLQSKLSLQISKIPIIQPT